MAIDDISSTILSGSSSDDSANPLFLHHSDHPGLLLVSKKLTGDNYNSWCRAMRISLSAKNKIGFITGTIKEPSAVLEPDEHALWQRCNDMVLSWMLNSLEPELADSVLCCTTPYAVWEDLRERFALGNAPRIFQVQRDIYRIEQGQSSIAAYYTKLKGLWDELASYNMVTCTCGAPNDRSKLMQFLMGLNESYAATRGQILLMNPLPSVRQAYASLVQEEKQREIGSSSLIPSNTAAMAVRSNFRSQPQMQGNQGNNQGSNQGGNFRSRVPIKHCTYCDRDHHTEATCHRKHGFPPGHRLYKGPKEANHARQRQGGPSANHVDAIPTFNELQGMIPNLTDDQYTQVIAALTPTPQAPQAHAASATEYATGLGYEDDDWCG